jgi:hypothetical protein
MTREISNSDDVIDSRDVIARIDELCDEREAFEHDDDGNLTGASWADSYPDDAAELAVLEKLASDGEDYAPDWQYGATLIRETYFSEYCEDMLKDIGDLPQDLPGYIAIDWDATANNIGVDYTEVDFDGVTYLVR